MNDVDLIIQLTVFVLAVFVGYEVISQGAGDAAHAADERHERDPRHHHRRRDHRRGRGGASTLTKVLGAIAVAFGAINVVGGFLVTDRMLQMFRRRRRRTV